MYVYIVHLKIFLAVKVATSQTTMYLVERNGLTLRFVIRFGPNIPLVKEPKYYNNKKLTKTINNSLGTVRTDNFRGIMRPKNTVANAIILN